MRIDTESIPQSLVESAKAIDKKELNNSESKEDTSEETQVFLSSPLGSSRIYSLSSLRNAVDCHAKFLTVAENNLTAVNHPSSIPQDILDRLNAVL